jgi:TRAP-type C4-dicarboxylate transport system permease small subunit
VDSAATPVRPQPLPADSLLARAVQRLQGIEKAIAVASIAGAALALVADLVGREIMGQGLFGAQRAAVHLTFVAGMLGFVLAVGTGSHLRVKATDFLVPDRWNPVMDRAASLLSAVLLLVLAWHASRFVLQTAGVNERSPTLHIPIWPIQAVMVWAFASAAFRYLAYAIQPALRPQGPQA